MPDIEVNGTRLHYIDVGPGAETPGDTETVVFSHSYLVDHRHFEPQIEALRGRYRVLAYDHRGHGRSAKVAERYSMQAIYADGVAFLEAMECGPVHWVGLSTGGFVGMRMGFRRPDLLRSLTLMDTSAKGEPLSKRIRYQAMFATLRLLGFRPIIGETMKVMFGPAFLRDPGRAEQRALWRQRMMDNDVPALVAFGNAIFGRDDVTAELADVGLPTLVISGEQDAALPPPHARELANAIPDAQLELIPRAGHLSTLEEPELVNEKLRAFLDGLD